MKRKQLLGEGEGKIGIGGREKGMEEEGGGGKGGGGERR